MEKLFEIVSSFIPDEQKADIEAQFNGEFTKTQNALKKDLSKTYGVNFFEEDVNKAFDNKAFVKQDLYLEQVRKVEELETNFNNLTTENTELQEKLKTLGNDKNYFDVSLNLIKEGLSPDKVNTIKPLIDLEKGVEDNVEKIKGDLPELFNVEVLQKNTFPKPKKETDMSPFEKHIYEQKTKKII